MQMSPDVACMPRGTGRRIVLTCSELQKSVRHLPLPHHQNSKFLLVPAVRQRKEGAALCEPAQNQEQHQEGRQKARHYQLELTLHMHYILELLVTSVPPRSQHRHGPITRPEG